MRTHWTVDARRLFILFAATACVMATTGRRAYADAAAADPCALLPATELHAVLGQQFGAPAKTPMPAAVANGVAGTQCRYTVVGGLPPTVTLIIYFDASAADAETNLAQLSKLFHPTKTLPGIADAVYLDASYGIHARQGRVRYYIKITPIDAYTPAVEKNLTDLTAYVAAHVK